MEIPSACFPQVIHVQTRNKNRDDNALTTKGFRQKIAQVFSLFTRINITKE